MLAQSKDPEEFKRQAASLGSAARTGDIGSVAPRGAAGSMSTMPQPYLRELREDVVRVVKSFEVVYGF
jgi:hypothetical protein